MYESHDKCIQTDPPPLASASAQFPSIQVQVPAAAAAVLSLAALPAAPDAATVACPNSKGMPLVACR